MSQERLRSTKTLITGGAGFLGVHLAQELAAHGAHLLLQDVAHKRPDLLAPALRSGRVDLLIGDLENLDNSPALLGHLANVDYVVHLGLRVPPETSDPFGAYLALNLPPFEHLLRRLPASVKGLCLASTLSVYGGPSGDPVAEHCPALPATPFAAMKLALEQAAQRYGQAAGFAVTLLRFSTLFGPGELHAPRAVPSFIRNLLAGQPPVIYGDGSDVYDYLWVKDAARAVRLALELGPAAAGTFNVGSGHGWSTRAVAETVQRQLQLALPPKHMPARGPRHALIADIHRARALLGFQPHTSLDDGLAAEIAYFQAHLGGGLSAAWPDEAPSLALRAGALSAGN